MHFGSRLAASLLTSLPLILPSAALAQPPSGLWFFSFSTPIWNLTMIQRCRPLVESGLPVTACLTISMTGNNQGKYSGTGTVTFTGYYAGALVGPAAGQVKGAPGKDPSGKFEIKGGTGSLVVQGQSIPTTVDVKCSGPIASIGFLEARCAIKVSSDDMGSAKIKQDYGILLRGGPFTVLFDLTAIDETKFEGTAVDSFVYGYQVSGKYDEKTGTSSLTAKGNKGDKNNPNPSKGGKIELKEFTNFGDASSKTKIRGTQAEEALIGTHL